MKVNVDKQDMTAGLSGVGMNPDDLKAADDHAAVVAAIRGAGLRATPQRIVLLSLLRNTTSHPSAEMLMNMAKDAGVTMTMGTVYNTLNGFEQRGLIQRVHDENEIMRYDANTSFHIHVVDRDSHEISDIFDDELNALIISHLAKHTNQALHPEKIDVTLYQ